MIYPWYVCPKTAEEKEKLQEIVRNSYQEFVLKQPLEKIQDDVEAGQEFLLNTYWEDKDSNW